MDGYLLKAEAFSGPDDKDLAVAAMAALIAEANQLHIAKCRPCYCAWLSITCQVRHVRLYRAAFCSIEDKTFIFYASCHVMDQNVSDTRRSSCVSEQ